MNRLIQVETTDGRICRMAPRALDLFLSKNRVARFRRSNGWVTVGLDPIRGTGNSRYYHGPNRRAA
ncbi:MAG: hypothetical protein C0616_10365 [Desulfuromonas sp.]|nr:MAG: hypothetical protein C0616_10365 [Desulfuromonas sp.]